MNPVMFVMVLIDARSCNRDFTVYLVSIGNDHFIKRQFYKGIIGKMTVSWSFSYNSFVKFMVKDFGATT